MLSTIFRIAICASSFCYTFYVLCNLTCFLSKVSIDNGVDLQEGLITKTLWATLLNVSLLSAFMFQHSVMASDVIKDIYYKFDIEDIERSVYNMSSSAVLHLLISNWQFSPWVTFWNFNTTQYSKLWFIISTLHIIGWGIIYFSSVMMDISELIGVKQIYYKISGRPRPMEMKSREYQRYLLHMRHPSFMGFLIILWIYPFMTLDRFILASLLTVYMALMWNIDHDDYNYHYVSIARKEIQLSNKNYYIR